MLLDRTDDLLDLAKSHDPRDRERLLMGVVALCEQGGSNTAQNEHARTLIEQVFMALVAQTEGDVRRKLAERVADAEWAPKALVNILALDEIEIARPVIAQSPILADSDLIRLMIEATLEHQIEIARRPNIDENVVEAILERSDPSALAALASNTTAHLTADGMNRLVDSSRRLPALRAPLSRHPKLTEALGARLYGWVGEALRTSLTARFQLDENALASAIAGAVQDAKSPPTPQSKLAPIDPGQTETERTLIEKLDAAGQLKPGFLLRALRERKLTLFQAALARIGGIDLNDLRKAMASRHPELLALACMAAGVDRGVFPALLARVRELNADLPGDGQAGLARAQAAFAVCPPASAAANFRRALATI